ncbi:MAG: hypothetical protein J6D29_07275 [Solobacterium sp.]|nr:hypothetical protein [Solobacterium sp.]
MKSDVITIESNGQGIEEALATTEAVANYKNLSHKDSLKLRLLTEEMMGLIQGLTGETRSEFYIETEEDQFKLHMRTQTFMDSTKRKNLLDATTSGKNAAAVGFIGTLRNLYESTFEYPDGNVANYISLGFVSSADPSAMSTASWSLGQYVKSVKDKEEAQEAWDELEKSIIVNVADEIEVSIKGDEVDMVVYKKFKGENA